MKIQYHVSNTHMILLNKSPSPDVRPCGYILYQFVRLPFHCSISTVVVLYDFVQLWLQIFSLYDLFAQKKEEKNPQ